MKIFGAIPLGVLLCCLPARAQSGLNRPQLGVMLDQNGAARPVYGVAASVTAGDASATGVLAIACSRRLCLMKTDSAVLASNSAVAAPAGTCLDRARWGSALVYFTQTKQLAQWHDGNLDPIPLEIAGEVLSIQAGPSGTLDAAFRRGGHVWIARVTLADGNAIETGSLPDDTGPVLLLKSGVVFADHDQVVLRHSDGSELSFPLTGVSAAFPLGDGYVQIRAGNLDYGLRIDPGREQLFLLPEPVQ